MLYCSVKGRLGKIPKFIKIKQKTTSIPSQNRILKINMSQNQTRRDAETGLLSRSKTTPPKRYGVYLLNDDYTTMDFVVEVLTEIFMLDEERAVAVMLLVHHEGKGLCGVYTRDIADTKQQQVLQRARQEGHPLQCIVEEV